jgi:hypothetical protein
MTGALYGYSRFPMRRYNSVCLSIEILFRLPLRQTAGMMTILLKLAA